MERGEGTSQGTRMHGSWTRMTVVLAGGRRDKGWVGVGGGNGDICNDVNNKIKLKYTIINKN